MKLGAASQVDPSGERSVASFVRHSSVTEKYGALLFRIAHWFKPEMIIELGIGSGYQYTLPGLGESGGTACTPLREIPSGRLCQAPAY